MKNLVQTPVAARPGYRLAAPERLRKPPVVRDEWAELRSVFGLLLRKKLWIVSATLVSAGAGAAYVLLTPPEYESRAIIAPKSIGRGSDMGLLANLGGLGTGVISQLGLGNTSLEHLTIVLRSHDFAEQLIEARPELLQRLYPQRFDSAAQRRKSAYYRHPTPLDAADRLQSSVLTVSPDARRGVITIAAACHNRILAKEIVSLCLETLNRKIRSDVAAEARENRRYLDSMLRSTPDPWMVSKIQGLIGREVEKGVLISARSFDVLESPMLPLRKSKPKSRLVLLLVTMLGLTASVFAVVVWGVFCWRDDAAGVRRVGDALSGA
jgi:LPS O-antigen subunit length determinant protein (WzzB/FepE family)